MTLWIHFFFRRDKLCALLLIFPETLGLTAGVVGIYLRNLEKDHKGNDSLGKNLCQQCIWNDPHYQLGGQTPHFIYSVYCMSTHLPSVTGSSLISQSLPQPSNLGRNTRLSLKISPVQDARKREKTRKRDRVHQHRSLGLCHVRLQVVLHILLAGNVFMVALIFPLILALFFSSPQPT